MSTSTALGELNSSAKIIENSADLHLNPDRSDVVLVVDGEKLPAHKFILNLRSPYFQALFGGDFLESSKSEIVLKVPLKAFKHVLRYIYTGLISLQEINHKTVLELLNLSEKYSMDELKLQITSYLKENVSLNNCCSTFDAACLYQSKELEGAALNVLDANAKAVLECADDFKTLPIASLCKLLQRNTLFVPELDLFQAVLKWRHHNPDVKDSDFQTIFSNIRFELIELEHLISTVRQSSVLSEKRLLDVIAAKTFTKNPNYRSDCKPGINVATIEFNAKVIRGSHPLELLNGNSSAYSDKIGFTDHIMTCGPDADCIIVKLDHMYMLNQIDMLLWDHDNRSYSYYIEVSTNQAQWRRVIDHTRSWHRSWQFLHFKAQPVQYIKIVGTRNTENTTFHAVHLAAYYKNDQPTLIDGLISPTSNVASKEQYAKVIKGKCRTGDTLDVLLNGNAINYTGSSGFVEHEIGTESIVIQLAQPFHIGSVRMLLWDGDDRIYSFYIETSTNQTDWTMAVDKRNERFRSWQEFSFEPRPVVFFKITGTYNSIVDNNGFHLVHFEAPNMSVINCGQKPKRQKL